MTNNRSITVVGLGYIGLPTAAMLAVSGHSVYGVEIRDQAVQAINSGQAHITEPGLSDLVELVVSNGKLKAFGRPIAADSYIVAVPTPITHSKVPDLTFVESATKSVCTVLKPGDLVIIESTVPPRTCVDVVAPLIERETGLKVGIDYDLAYCPERVIPGRILAEIVNNDRIIGGVTPQATQRTAELYATFVKGELLLTDATTAEMCKLMENTYRDVNIALANELAGIAEALGVNITEAIALANHHPRVHVHQPGIGVGGHCIPVDPWFLLNGHEAVAPMIQLGRTTNDRRPADVAARITKEAKLHPDLPVLFLGLAYKPDVDDFRESPAIQIVRECAQSLVDADVIVCDPYLTELPPALQADNVRVATLNDLETYEGIIVQLVNHSAFLDYKLNPAAIVLNQETHWMEPIG